MNHLPATLNRLLQLRLAMNPQQGLLNSSSPGDPSHNPLDGLVQTVLKPLAASLVEDRSQKSVMTAALLLTNPETVLLVQQIHVSLEELFRAYATANPLTTGNTGGMSGMSKQSLKRSKVMNFDNCLRSVELDLLLRL